MNENHKKSARQMFTHDEDAKHRNIVNYFQARNELLDWESIAKLMETKNARQCKDRWCYYLDNDVNRSPFTSDENYLLLWSISRIGKKWTQISQLFPNRTDVSIKTQYKKLMRRDATLDNVYQISNAKYYKHPKKKEDETNETSDDSNSKNMTFADLEDDELFH